MKLRDLFVSIGFDVDDKALKTLNKGLDKTKTMITAVGVAGAAAAGMLYGMAKNVADVGDKAAKTADKLGVGIEALQEMRHAAELSGVAQNNFDTGLQRLTRRAAEAAAGTGVAKDAFEELGVSLVDNQGNVRKSEDLMADLAEAFAKIPDQSRKVSLAFKLFDTEGVSMVNMLNQGRNGFEAMREEARRLGIVLDEETARKAEKFQDELLRAKSVVAGLKNQVGGELLPVFIDLFGQFREFVLLNRKAIKSGVTKFIRGLIRFIKVLYKALARMVSILTDIADLFGGIENMAKGAAWAMGLFAGAQILMGLGQMAMGLVAIVKAFKAVKLAALAANLQMLAIPLLIGAAVVAAVFIIQDIVSFFQGKKSVTGIIVEKFKEAFSIVQQKAAAFKEYLFRIFQAIHDFILNEILQPIFDKIERFTKLGSNFIGGITKAGGSMIEKVFSVVSPAPSSSPAASPRLRSPHSRINVNAPITVTVPEGTSPHQVGPAVKQGVSDGIARMIRETARATEPMVEY